MCRLVAADGVVVQLCYGVVFTLIDFDLLCVFYARDDVGNGQGGLLYQYDATHAPPVDWITVPVVP